MAYLIFPKTGNISEYYSLESMRIIIGRDESSDVLIGDASVSRQHAQIIRVGDNYRIEDLQSKNGIRVNGRSVEDTALVDGDTLHFGDIRAQFRTTSLNSSIPESNLTRTLTFSRESLEKADQKLNFLYEFAASASVSRDESAVIDKALEIVGNKLGCDNVYLGLCNDGSVKIAHGFSRNFRKEGERFTISKSILNRAIEADEGVLVIDAGNDALLQDKASIQAAKIKSVAAVPIRVAGACEGVLYADTRTKVVPFSEQDLTFLAALGAFLGATLRSLRAMESLRIKNRELQKRLEGLGLIGDSLRMSEVREKLERFASRGDAPVLITGESGTGKELAARTLHNLSSRPDEPFIAVNCAAIPAELIESELFGHVKGAFTSATRDRRGLFALADKGTLFLDEIGEMPIALQSKLLRVLETGEFLPVGAEKSIRNDVRIVTATNRILADLIKESSFRQDLYYRLNVLTIEMPALREHREDIPMFAEHFLNDLRMRMSTNVRGFSKEAMDLMMHYEWPGNVRELRNIVERALYSCDESFIFPEHLEGLDKSDGRKNEPPLDCLSANSPLEKQIEDLERTRIREALEHHEWNKSHAAADLGIARKTLIAKVKKYNL